MNCDQAIHVFAALEAGTLTEGTRAELAQHVVACPACRRALASAIMEAAPADGSGPHRAPDADQQNIAAALTRARRW